MNPLRVRWLGTVPYHEAWSLQRALHDRPGDPGAPTDDHLLLLEHPHTYTLGRNAEADHVLVEPSSVGAELVAVDRGGDVTYHGPGQLVAYPIVTLDPSPRTKDYVHLLEDVLIDALRSVGLGGAGRHDGYPGVWVAPNTASARKVAQIGVRVERGRTLHGVALNVAPDMTYFGHIVPCGITDYGVTSLAEEGVDASMRQVVDALAEAFVARWGARAAALGAGPLEVDRADVVWRRPTVAGQALDDADLAPFSRGLGPGERTTGANATVGEARPAAAGAAAAAGGTSVRLLGRLAEAGVTQAVALTDRKPDWMRAPVRHGADVLGVKRTVRDLGLITVCEEAGCPNLSECWSDGTATFMVCGERCTRACGFCLVDTRHPGPLQADEPERVAEAVARMDLSYAVITMVARDDLPDGGAAHVAATVRAIRDRRPGTSVEVLISDLKGDAAALDVVLAAEPDVVNHNVETVARLQRAVRPSAGYARSLALLGRSALAGRTTKSGLVLGLGETADEVTSTLADLAAVGVQIVTIGQYLRPTSHHLPVSRWWTPEDFERFAEVGRSLGLAHVESSPFTRSSYHARGAAEAATPVAVG
ncbi:lipoyl synthase [Dermatobacter hominis]|uniref:lipoyl synthase n=1 Tax=Dermatobacter hominis TaxID=2884263 RepID=UPI001D10EFC3|nr:lipoyl synthase [Dermatobacter hominis]UDY35542.1 lipoyl synthase [Dermatobacter hominis]